MSYRVPKPRCVVQTKNLTSNITRLYPNSCALSNAHVQKVVQIKPTRNYGCPKMRRSLTNGAEPILMLFHRSRSINNSSLSKRVRNHSQTGLTAMIRKSKFFMEKTLIDRRRKSFSIMFRTETLKLSHKWPKREDLNSLSLLSQSWAVEVCALPHFSTPPQISARAHQPRSVYLLPWKSLRMHQRQQLLSQSSVAWSCFLLHAHLSHSVLALLMTKFQKSRVPRMWPKMTSKPPRRRERRTRKMLPKQIKIELINTRSKEMAKHQKRTMIRTRWSDLMSYYPLMLSQ